MYSTYPLVIVSSLWQFQKKWAICLNYRGFWLGIELQLVIAATDSILWLTQILGAEYKLQLSQVQADGCRLWLIQSYGWLELPQLDMSCGWFYPAVNSSSGGWIQVVAVSSSDSRVRVTAGYILQLTWVPAAGYNLRLILPCGQLESIGWTRLVADLHFNISSKFKDLFCKIHHFYCLFSTAWFQLLLIQVAALRSLKKLEDFLAATDSSCSGWFELRWLIWDLQDLLNQLPPEFWLWYPLIQLEHNNLIVKVSVKAAW